VIYDDWFNLKRKFDILFCSKLCPLSFLMILPVQGTTTTASKHVYRTYI